MKFKVTLLVLVIIMAQVGFSNAKNAHNFLKKAHATDTVDPEVAERICHQLLEDGEDQVSDELAHSDFEEICKAAGEKKVTFSEVLDQWFRIKENEENDDEDDGDDDEQASIGHESAGEQPVQSIYCGVSGSKIFITKGDTYSLEIKGDSEDIKTIETGIESDTLFIRNRNSDNQDNKRCEQGIVCIDDVCGCAGQKREPLEEICCPNGIRCVDNVCICTQDGSVVNKWLKSNKIIIQPGHGGKFCTFGNGIVQNTQREKNVEIYLTLPGLEKIELDGVGTFIISGLRGLKFELSAQSYVDVSITVSHVDTMVVDIHEAVNFNLFRSMGSMFELAALNTGQLAIADADFNMFEAHVSGMGELKISGQARELTVALDEEKTRTLRLNAKDTSRDGSCSKEITVYATEGLDIRASDISNLSMMRVNRE